MRITRYKCRYQEIQIMKCVCIITKFVMCAFAWCGWTLTNCIPVGASWYNKTGYDRSGSLCGLIRHRQACAYPSNSCVIRSVPNTSTLQHPWRKRRKPKRPEIHPVKRRKAKDRLRNLFCKTWSKKKTAISL